MTTIPIAPEGRWGGDVTSRPLPDAQDELDAMDPAMRRAVAAVWWAQCATELRVAQSFAVVHESLVALRAEASLIALAERAVDDEHRHGALCLEVARRYDTSFTSAPPSLPRQQPVHALAKSEDERRALYVLGQCALNETFASAYLSIAHHDATCSLARAGLNELLRDEIDHSRLGWAYVSTLSPALRARMSDWLLPLTIQNLREWQSSAASHEGAIIAHGVPSADGVREALADVVRGVILPGFATNGLDVRALERWVRAGMPVA